MSEDDFARLCLAEDKLMAAIGIYEEGIQTSLRHLRMGLEGLQRSHATLKDIRERMAGGRE